MPCHHIAVKLIKRFAGVLQTVGKWYLLKNYLTVRRSNQEILLICCLQYILSVHLLH